MFYLNADPQHFFDIRRGDGLWPIGFSVAVLMARAGCPWRTVQDVFADAARYDDPRGRSEWPQ